MIFFFNAKIVKKVEKRKSIEWESQGRALIEIPKLRNGIWNTNKHFVDEGVQGFHFWFECEEKWESSSLVWEPEYESGEIAIKVNPWVGTHI